MTELDDDESPYFKRLEDIQFFSEERLDINPLVLDDITQLHYLPKNGQLYQVMGKSSREGGPGRKGIPVGIRCPSNNQYWIGNRSYKAVRFLAFMHKTHRKSDIYLALKDTVLRSPMHTIYYTSRRTGVFVTQRGPNQEKVALEVMSCLLFLDPAYF